VGIGSNKGEAQRLAWTRDNGITWIVPAYSLRALRPGDIGWITYRQEMLYLKEYGWNEEFEAIYEAAGFELVAEE
jgi:hypothetical protein